MIKSVNNYPISTLLNVDQSIVYFVPRYQREYTWSKIHWDRLFDDLLENDAGYFLGSIICINQSDDTHATQELEVVDGQQRITTLSLMLAAIYSALDSLDGSVDEELIVEKSNIKKKLILKDSDDFLRVVPQVQNYNQGDFRGVLSEIGIIQRSEYPPYAGNRKIVRAFKHFQKRLLESIEKQKENSPESNPRRFLKDFVNKVNNASLVKIEVASHADAYVLFESLNDRGVPLSVIDLIKNKLLAKIEKDDPSNVDYYYTQWQSLLRDLGDKYATHERFFRHFYNAFRDDLKETVEVPLATKSNLVSIYEKLINADAKKCLTDTAAAARLYSSIISNREEEAFRDLSRPLKNLERIQGAPSYVLLLNLLKRRKDYGLNTSQLRVIVETLVKFFVRRNLTDSPATNEVTRLPVRLIDKVRDLKGEDLVSKIKSELGSVSSTDAEFKRRLSGSIYNENEGVARFVLIALAENSMNLETFTDLWEQRNGQWIWSIEHIFPQGENIPQHWVDIMADGDMEKAKILQQEYVHRLGNLTITGYNSSLGNKSFEEKRDRVNDRGLPIGYKNGLGLNSELANAESWSVKQIIMRGDQMVEKALELFRLEGVPE